MNKNETEKKDNSPIPETPEPAFLDTFNQEFWHLFQRAEKIRAAETERESLKIGDEAKNKVEFKVPEIRQNCFTFKRCEEIGRGKSTTSKVESEHLQDCRFCERRIGKFAMLPAFESPKPEARSPSIAGLGLRIADSAEAESRRETQSEIINATGNGQKPLFFDWFNDFFAARFKQFAFASLAVILLAVSAVIIYQINSPRRAEEISVVAPKNTENSSKNTLENRQTENIANLGTNVNNANSVKTPAANLEIKSSPETPKNQKGNEPNTNLSADAPKNTENLPKNNVSPESPIDLATIPKDEISAVREALKTGKIPFSDDAEKLTKRETLRGNEAAETGYPKNEAVQNNSPTFVWKGKSQEEFRITVKNLARQEVAKSEILTENSGQLPKNLDGGIYFWQIETRKIGETEFKQTSRPIIFKVLSEAEKAKVAQIKQNKSNVARAVVYARLGLFAEAENELKKDLSSDGAQKMLRQLQNRQK